MRRGDGEEDKEDEEKEKEEREAGEGMVDGKVGKRRKRECEEWGRSTLSNGTLY